MNNDTPVEPIAEEAREENDSTRHDKRLLRSKLPADPSVLYAALQLASDKNIRISKLADTVLLDPVITLEVLSKANTTYSSADKAGITAVQSAVIRIGSENLAELFLELKNREEIADKDVSLEFESTRRLATRAGQVAEILSNHLQRDISETAQTAGNLAYIGQMLCCNGLGKSYLELSSLKRRNALAYRLHSTYKIDLQGLQIQYLKDKGFPGFIFFAFDKELKCKTSAQSSLRFITESAIEIVEAIEDGKWEKYLSPHTFPGKSNLRLLKISDHAFELIKEEIEEILDLEKKAKGDFSVPFEEIEEPSLEFTTNTLDSIQIESLPPEIDSIDEVKIEQIPNEPSSPNEIPVSSKKEYDRTDLSVDSQAIFGLMQYLCEEADSVSSLLKDLMAILTEQGPFNRAAIIQMLVDTSNAKIHTAIGEDFEEIDPNMNLEINDPLSPISLLATRVQSFNCEEKSDNTSPFGITSYAVSPITPLNSSPLILYADCGLSRPVPLEARKVFRMVVQLLNRAIPQVAEKAEKKRQAAETA
jgi:hypothetical protein